MANRLFRQDRMAAWNGLRATFARPRDRVIAALMLVAALAVLRAVLVDRPWSVAVRAAIGAGAPGGLLRSPLGR